LSDAALLVQKRGQLMQETVPLGQGAMAAIIGMSDEDVEQLCARASKDLQQVTPANFNAIGQVVIAGHTQAVERAITLAGEMGAILAKNIPVSVPCHCPLLMEAAREFMHDLQRVDFKVPRVPVISNVDLSRYESADQIRALLSEQLYRPVRWVETIQSMKNSGITRVVECGPGKVLSGLIKRIDKSLQAVSVNNLSSLDSALTLLG
jgi:[acyl-carrier-protein] S-malonyltransferase